MILCSFSALANDNDAESIKKASNIFYYDYVALVSRFGYSGYGTTILHSINYERAVIDNIGIRTGFGFYNRGFLKYKPFDDNELYFLMMNVHSNGNNKFNFGIGALLKKNWRYALAVNASYRYQPYKGGIYFSTGISTYNISYGFNISMGYVF